MQIVNFFNYCTLFLTTAHLIFTTAHFTTAHFSLDNCTFLADYCTICVQLHAIANAGAKYTCDFVCRQQDDPEVRIGAFQLRSSDGHHGTERRGEILPHEHPRRIQVRCTGVFSKYLSVQIVRRYLACKLAEAYFAADVHVGSTCRLYVSS